jgi:hypothetical protein
MKHIDGLWLDAHLAQERLGLQNDKGSYGKNANVQKNLAFVGPWFTVEFGFIRFNRLCDKKMVFLNPTVASVGHQTQRGNLSRHTITQITMQNKPPRQAKTLGEGSTQYQLDPDALKKVQSLIVGFIGNSTLTLKKRPFVKAI